MQSVPSKEVHTEAENFEQRFPADKRLQLATRYITNHPSCIPIVMQHHTRPVGLHPHQKRWAMEREYITMDLLKRLRQDSKFSDKRESLFIFVRKPQKMLRLNNNLGELYDKHKSEDGWMYLLYGTEDAFGAQCAPL